MGLKIIQKDPKRFYVELWADQDGDWTFAPDEEFLNEVNAWVGANELGHRLSYNGWKLRDAGALTVFLLRWQPI